MSLRDSIGRKNIYFRQLGQLLHTIVKRKLQQLPLTFMHLMGMMRIADKDLAIAWPRRTPHAVVMALREHGYRVEFLSDLDAAQANRALNFVTLGPRRILMPAGNDATKDWYESLGIDVVDTPMYELRKAAGAVGCLTGVMERAMAE